MIRALAIGCLLLAMGCGEKGISKPNILLIVTDDQGYGDVGYNGNEVLETPNLDRLASRSIVFDRFYVSPVCAPTRASLLTGKYHLSTGVTWVTHRKEVMNQSENTIAEFLKKKGYTTGLFGKWHNGKQFPHDPIGQGFDEFIGFKAGHFNNYFDPVLVDRFEPRSYKGYLPDIVTQEAISFIKSSKKPFFGMVTYNTPHSPFQVPDKYFEKYKEKGLSDRLSSIYGMIENIDNNVGRLINEIEASGHIDNTLIFFVGDNGPNGERYNAGLKGIKSHVDEGGVRVPALMSYPSNDWDTGERVKHLAAHIDLLPTIAALLDEPIDVDGTDLANVIEGTAVDRTFFTHQVVRKFARYPGAVRSSDYVLTIKDGQNELFHLKTDPGQATDLSDSLPAVAEHLRVKYDNWLDHSIQDLKSPELIEVGHKEVRSIYFPAQEVASKVNVSFQGNEGWSNDYFINFTDSSVLTWDLKSVSSATYQCLVSMHALAGTELIMKLNDSTFSHILIDEDLVKRKTKSPDRIERKEVYQYEWPTADLGIIALEEDVYSLILETKNPKEMAIKSIQLIKINE